MSWNPLPLENREEREDREGTGAEGSVKSTQSCGDAGRAEGLLTLPNMTMSETADHGVITPHRQFEGDIESKKNIVMRKCFQWPTFRTESRRQAYIFVRTPPYPRVGSPRPLTAVRGEPVRAPGGGAHGDWEPHGGRHRRPPPRRGRLACRRRRCDRRRRRGAGRYGGRGRCLGRRSAAQPADGPGHLGAGRRPAVAGGAPRAPRWPDS